MEVQCTRDTLIVRYQGSARTPEGRFTTSIRNLFAGMGKSREAVPPLMLLNELRTLAPQFAEMDPTGRGFAQQGAGTGFHMAQCAHGSDADEAWTQIISALRHSLSTQSSYGSFIDDYMSAELTKTYVIPDTWHAHR